jgi:hypothetical protein
VGCDGAAKLAERGLIEEGLALQPRADGAARSRRAVLLEGELPTVSGRDTHAHDFGRVRWGVDASELRSAHTQVRRRSHPRASTEAVEAMPEAADAVEDADGATEAAVEAVGAADAADAAHAVADAVGTAEAVVDTAEEKRAEEQVENEAVEMMIEAEHGVKGLIEAELKKKGHTPFLEARLASIEKGMDGAVAKVVEETADEEISELRVRCRSLLGC